MWCSKALYNSCFYIERKNGHILSENCKKGFNKKLWTHHRAKFIYMKYDLLQFDRWVLTVALHKIALKDIFLENHFNVISRSLYQENYNGTTMWTDPILQNASYKKRVFVCLNHVYKTINRRILTRTKISNFNPIWSKNVDAFPFSRLN